MRTNERPDSVLRDEAAAIAADLFPDDVNSNDATTVNDDVLIERIEYSEDVHWMAERTGERSWVPLADAVCSPASHALDAVFWTYKAAFPEGFWRSPREEDVARLRQAVKALVDARPRTAFEFAWKVRLVVLVGIHARIRRLFSEGGPDASAAYDQLRANLYRIPNAGFAGALLPRLQPAWINELDEVPPNPDEMFIRQAIHDAGPALRASIAADVERLKVLVSEKG